MKKVLSLFLAVLMLCSCLSVSAFAAEGTVVDTQWHGPAGSGKPATYQQVVVQFNPMGGTFKTPLNVWDLETGKFIPVEGLTETYTMVPGPGNTEVMKETHKILLPTVIPPKGWNFIGWYCSIAPANTDQGKTFGAADYTLPAGSAGTVMYFEAAYTPAEVEENTMAKVMGILIKVFGAILGILLYGGDSEMGQAVLEKIFGNLL